MAVKIWILFLLSSSIFLSQKCCRVINPTVIKSNIQYMCVYMFMFWTIMITWVLSVAKATDTKGLWKTWEKHLLPSKFNFRYKIVKTSLSFKISVFIRSLGWTEVNCSGISPPRSLWQTLILKVGSYCQYPTLLSNDAMMVKYMLRLKSGLFVVGSIQASLTYSCLSTHHAAAKHFQSGLVSICKAMGN